MMPAISKSGTVAYVNRSGTAYQLVVGGRVVSKGALHVSPAFTPDGGVLAGISGPNDTNIFRISGGRASPVTKSFGINISPTVSPDGSRMAFVSDRSGNAQIYVSSMSGGGASRLTSGSESTDPSWSPKGDRIAFCGKSSNIFTIKTDGSDLQQLTSGSGRNTHPSWSPDGRMIVFSSTRLGRSQLFTMTANGERQQPLLPDLGIGQRSPAWSPAPPDLGGGG
jgi:TolB protein